MDIKTVTQGDGKNFPKAGDKVTVHYTGRLTDGKKFDSSRDRGKAFEFNIGSGNVIAGWDLGIAQMSLGQIAVINVFPSHAYGEQGIPGVVPQNSTLVFNVQLMKIN